MSQYIYVAATFDNSLTVLDVTDPTVPVFKSNIMGKGAPNFLGAIFDVAKVGNYCYCCSMGNFYPGHPGDGCLTIIDVSDPANPTFVSSLPVGTGPEGKCIFISGNLAYIADETTGLYIVDISNPATPFIVGSILHAALGLTSTYDIHGTYTGGQLGRPYKLGNYCYLASVAVDRTVDTDNALLVVDVSNPAVPTLAGSIRGAANHLQGVWVFASGNYAYFAAGLNASGGGLTIIDISNPAAPTLKGFIGGAGAPNFLSECITLWKEGNYCYCGAALDGLTIIDVTNPAAPVFVSNVNGHVAETVQKRGNYCYTAAPNFANTVNVIDVTNPAASAIVGSISGAGAPNYLNFPVFVGVESSWVPPVVASGFSRRRVVRSSR